LPPSMNSML